MLFNWFDATDAKKFGEEMAQLLDHRSSASGKKQASATNGKLDKHHQVTLNLVERRLAAFKKTHKLNIYTKAQLGSSFKYALLDRGYDPEFCNSTTTWLLVRCK